MTNITIIYHANCTDGLTAAWVAARALSTAKTNITVVPAFYGTPPPDVTGQIVYVLDFSYKRPLMEQLANQADRLIVLDHHKTAQADLDGLAADRTNVTIVFDMKRSGARLAWDWFHCAGRPLPVGQDVPLLSSPRLAPWLVEYVQDRDLWTWALPNSRLVCAAIESYPRTFEAWDALADRPLAIMFKEGEVVQRYREQCIAAGVELARPLVLDNRMICAANSSEMRFASDIAAVLAENQPFGATWWVRADGVVQFSLRSRADGEDVSAIAVRYGGGGHQHAAGFQTTLEHLLVMFNDRRAVGAF